MTDATVMHTDLDLLAERVEKAAALVQELRNDNARLERERDEAMRKMQGAERELQGQNVPSLLTELQTLRKEQRDWQGERKEVAGRIEGLLKKLERLEG